MVPLAYDLLMLSRLIFLSYRPCAISGFFLTHFSECRWGPYGRGRQSWGESQSALALAALQQQLQSMHDVVLGLDSGCPVPAPIPAHVDALSASPSASLGSSAALSVHLVGTRAGPSTAQCPASCHPLRQMLHMSFTGAWLGGLVLFHATRVEVPRTTPHLGSWERSL